MEKFPMADGTSVSVKAAPRLRRTLGLWDLVLYGLIVIQPTAPMPVFGVMTQRAVARALA